MSNKINAKKLAEAITAVLLAALGQTDAANDSDDAVEDAPKRGRPAGSTNKPKPAAGKKPTKPDPLDEDEEEEEDGDGLGLDEDEEEVTQEDVVAAFKALKASHGLDKCKEVLAKLDESNVLNIPAKRYGETLKEIQRAASKKK